VAVAVGNVDSFVSVPGAGVDRPGVYVTVMGTSTCDMVVHPDEIRLPGITGVVRDGILPGLYGYEAGQPAVGDMLAWFVDTLMGGTRTFGDLEEQAARLSPGATGLLALAWWNGNRSILANADLSGVLLGLNLRSSAVDVYRSLLEAIALATRRIMDNFEEHGLPLSEIVAVGGIPARSPLLMQLLADTTGREVHVPASTEIPARGSALFGALAGGVYRDITEAIAATRPATARTYTPDPTAAQAYENVYSVYRDVYELLGRTHVELLHKLKRIRTEGSGA
jgi:L-ribulokinase